MTSAGDSQWQQDGNVETMTKPSLSISFIFQYCKQSPLHTYQVYVFSNAFFFKMTNIFTLKMAHHNSVVIFRRG